MTTFPANQNVYQRITDQVIAALDAGALTFTMPWHKGHPRPVNVASGNPYRGINTVNLWIAQQLHDYTTGTWGTYRQWQAHGAQVRKEERATAIIFFKNLEREDPTQPSFIVVTSSVFNADQVDGYTAPLHAEDKTQVLAQVETFIAATAAQIKEQGTRAYYRPLDDTIHMPPRALFTGSATRSATESYYSTLLHELTHWTGHPARLKRDLQNRFGEAAYAMEELVAELGAAFLCADLGITLEPRPDHAAYIQSWLSVLKQDKRAIFTAASQASAASDYLLTLQPQPLEHAA